MSGAVPTITIETENGPVDINLSDFDRAVHKVYEGNETSADEVQVAPKTGKGRK